jgi:DNA-directed RNA polymerase beta subunit
MNIPRIKQPIELFVVFRALGILSDKAICEYILLQIPTQSPEQKLILEFLQASIIDANKYMTQEDALRHITAAVAYTPINMDKEKGARKKQEFTNDVLNNDLFPHCKTLTQKLYMIGYMCQKLIKTSFGWRQPDDRDSYVNKRIELTGTLLNNLFRNYFNKLVKEMQKQVVREINNGSWRSMDNYENIINMTNIYKIMKSTTIENGINRALATGDFSIKQSNSSKVGVAQVLNRLTYLSSLSHSRRINTPLEKSGELIAPRKLHNTTYGFLCLTGDSEVLMSNRIDMKKIKDIHEGDFVNTVNRTTLMDEPSPIYNFFGKMPDRLFEITTISGRTIKATADHPFLVNQGNGVYEMVKLCDLRTGDNMVIRHMVKMIPDENTTRVMIPTRVVIHESDVLEYYRKELLERNLLNTSIPIYKLKILARLIGAQFFGSSKYLQTEEDAHQLANDITQLGFDDFVHVIKTMDQKYKVILINDIEHVISSCYEYFIHLVGGNAFELPAWLLTAERSIKREFLSAFLGRGLSHDFSNTLYTEKRVYMQHVADMLSEFSIQCRITYLPFTPNLITTVSVVIDNDSLEQYYDTIGFTYCEKNRRQMIETIELHKISTFYKQDMTPPVNWSVNGCVSVPILSIREIEPEMVYDFTTCSENHSFVSQGFVISNCSAETPEGQSIGVVKNIAYMAHITIPTNSSSLYDYILPHIHKVEDAVSPSELYGKVRVFINGAWVGVSDHPYELYTEIKEKKHKGIINIYTSIIFDYKNMEIRVCNDGGRLTRPLLRVKDNRALITADIIRQLSNNELTWNDMLVSCRIPHSAIEYIDPEEQNFAMIAMKTKDGYIMTTERDVRDHSNVHRLVTRYTHCEIHPSTIFGVLASCIPFPEHNQSPRNTYQCCMGKQAIGVYALNYDTRMDKTSYVLSYPSRPLVDTLVMNFMKLNNIPSGHQITVAIMSFTAYNQEDSLLVNKGSIDRGLFMTTVYHTEKDEDKNIIRDEIIRCKPDPAKTKGIKYGNYDKLNPQGFIPENSLVENRDVIIAKTVPIKENRNDPTKTIKYEDQSKTFRTTEECYIDKNYTGRNGDGYNFAKVRVRTLRKPVLGDKFCALPTQQVLTNHGWIEIQNIDLGVHQLCTLDVRGNMCYETPSHKFVYDHDGDMYYMKNKQVHVVCTLNHKLYVKRRVKNAKYELLEAKDVMGKMVRFQKTMNNVYPEQPTILLGTKEYPMDAWLQLLGMFISDGCCDIQKGFGRIHIACFKDRKIDFNKEILDKLNVNYYDNTEKHGKIYISGTEYPEIHEELYALSVGALNKRLPDYVWNLSQRQSRVLMDALLQGDGHTMKYKGEDVFSRYGTISIQLTNDISRLALHCGWSGIVKIASEPDGIPHKCVATMGSRSGKESTITQKHTYYKVSIIRSQNQPWINKKTNDSNEEKIISYTGKIYCVEMPSSHTYYMREDTHSPAMIIGNSSRAGQKGTCGLIIPEADMPFTKDGLRPDIILNPHAIPSRMTIGQLKETILGKVLLELGIFGDGTSFGNLDVKTICKELQRVGYESYGNEIMYNGFTGEQIETSIFIGPVYYQRLKHMVNDKQHSRSIGPMVNLTRQPAEGRSRDGGFRIGEMERDVMIAHGMSRFCRERLYDVSDKYSTHVCGKCGMIACYNDESMKQTKFAKSDMSIHLCRTCGNMTDFAKVEIPYAYKLLSQELQTINIVPRIITE